MNLKGINAFARNHPPESSILPQTLQLLPKHQICQNLVVISTVLSGIKNGDSINIDQISARVTQEVEKSNFYRDLETLIDIDFKKLEDKNKST